MSPRRGWFNLIAKHYNARERGVACRIAGGDFNSERAWGGGREARCRSGNFVSFSSKMSLHQGSSLHQKRSIHTKGYPRV